MARYTDALQAQTVEHTQRLADKEGLRALGPVERDVMRFMIVNNTEVCKLLTGELTRALLMPEERASSAVDAEMKQQKLRLLRAQATAAEVAASRALTRGPTTTDKLTREQAHRDDMSAIAAEHQRSIAASQPGPLAPPGSTPVPTLPPAQAAPLAPPVPHTPTSPPTFEQAAPAPVPVPPTPPQAAAAPLAPPTPAAVSEPDVFDQLFELAAQATPMDPAEDI
ncbi:hypothetical protein [Tritonibacter mobilis]|uniref:hypothetical protein n=1 Tax=Tritonibacter mobilis TaxID=379347 RepID=UPI0013A66668|nr:hypothetical protein [Tritonibacter mobilis]